MRIQRKRDVANLGTGGEQPVAGANDAAQDRLPGGLRCQPQKMRCVKCQHKRLVVARLRNHGRHGRRESLGVQHISGSRERQVGRHGGEGVRDPAAWRLRRHPFANDLYAIHDFARGRFRLGARCHHGHIIAEAHEITTEIKRETTHFGREVNALLQNLHSAASAETEFQSDVVRGLPVRSLMTTSAMRAAA